MHKQNTGQALNALGRIGLFCFWYIRVHTKGKCNIPTNARPEGRVWLLREQYKNLNSKRTLPLRPGPPPQLLQQMLDFMHFFLNVKIYYMFLKQKSLKWMILNKITLVLKEKYFDKVFKGYPCKNVKKYFCVFFCFRKTGFSVLSHHLLLYVVSRRQFIVLAHIFHDI